MWVNSDVAAIHLLVMLYETLSARYESLSTRYLPRENVTKTVTDLFS